MTTLGFLINPIAGMGGRVGLKGTDGVVQEAIRRGARPIAQDKAAQALDKLRRLAEHDSALPDVSWLTCSGRMGADALTAAGFAGAQVVHVAPEQPTRSDTAEAARRMKPRSDGWTKRTRRALIVCDRSAG